MAINSDYAKQMATQLAGYEVQPSLDRLNRNEARYKSQREALSALRSALTTFKSAVGKLRSTTSSMLTNKATFSQEGYLSATVGKTAQPGNYQFFVEKLASKQQVAVQGLGDGPLSGSLTLNGKTVDLTGKTLDAVAAEINATALLGVKATLVRSDGAVNLVLSSAESGAANAFSLTVAHPDATTQTLSSAQDALLRMGGSFGSGGITLTSSSNTFSNVIEGVSLTASKVHQAGDQALSLDISQDKAATKGKAQSFVDAFNTLLGSFDSLTASGNETAKRGALAGDSSVRAIESRLNGLLRTDFGGKSLIDFGISADRNGKLTIDNTRFEAAVAADPAGFEALFTGTGNLLENLDKTVNAYTSSANGMLKNRLDTLDLSTRRIREQFDNLQQQHDRHYNRYLKQFTTMMQTMQSMEQTQGMFG